MNEFSAVRRSMVEGQIRPNRVTDSRVVAAMAEVPRELFVPRALRGVAYVDEDIEIAPGRYLMEPRVFARLIQAAAIAEGDIVLDIGCGRGYSTAVLARLAATVVALESDQDLAAKAGETLAKLEIDNAVVVGGALAEGYPEQGPYDVIFVSGAVDEVPEALTAQLAEGGRLAAVIGRGGAGRATLIVRHQELLARRALFEAAAPLLPGFATEPGFVF
jgi:protein-L-isoaspartate(D-aspartate) O-methyltransferase